MNIRKLLFYLFLGLNIFVFVWSIYRLLFHDLAVLWAILYIGGSLFMIRGLLRVNRLSLDTDPGVNTDLSFRQAPAQPVTPDFISDLLADERIIHIIRDDLSKTGQIGYHETWRLGVISPEQDWFDPNPDLSSRLERTQRFITDSNYRAKWVEQVPCPQSAVLYPTTYFNIPMERLSVVGSNLPTYGPRYAGRLFYLSAQPTKDRMISIREITVTDHSSPPYSMNRPLPEFLIEKGFALQPSYTDGDPFTTDRGGVIVIDREKLSLIYPHYFVQRRLVDNNGRIVDLGIDEDLRPGNQVQIKMRPSVSEKLIRTVQANRYTPVLRYRSIPYESDFMVSILDTPMSASGWADLYIDPRKKARLFIAREKTEEEWYKMMSLLQQLFNTEMAKKEFHLLGITQDRSAYVEYMAKKMTILQDYFIIRDFWL